MQVFTCVLDWMELWFMELGTIELFVCNRWRKNASCKLRQGAVLWIHTNDSTHAVSKLLKPTQG